MATFHRRRNSAVDVEAVNRFYNGSAMSGLAK